MDGIWWIGGYGMNTNLQYAAVLGQAAGFQARRLLVYNFCFLYRTKYLNVFLLFSKAQDQIMDAFPKLLKELKLQIMSSNF